MILVTGASGFIGRILCEELRLRKIPFRPVSRSPREGYLPIGEIDSDTNWRDALGGISTIVHLAARVHKMNDAAADPLVAFRAANVDATLNLARQAADGGVKRFIFISSIKVNGEETRPGQPFTADDNPNPHDPYGQSKREAEQALWDLAKETSMDIVVIRPPLVYGPGVKANFRTMIRWVKSGLPLPLGAVKNKRSFVFVRNLADLIILCAAHPAAANQVFLVSDGKDMSTTDLLRRMAKALHRPSRLIAIPPGLLSAAAALLGKRAMARRLFASLQIDIAKTRNLLNWTPPIPVDQGLRETALANNDN